MSLMPVARTGHMTCFMSCDWLKDIAQVTRTSQLMDFTL